MRQSEKLKGYRVPGKGDKLIANLFADDTTVFLSCDDKFTDLQEILDSWCTASTAKFNIPKTEIIPIGTEDYRAQVVANRNTQEGDAHYQIPQNLHIARDGEAVRILGAWVGNKVKAAEVWTPILEKIDTRVDHWAQGHITIEGRRFVVQMMVGGTTQYLTKVQGMPKQIERRLIKRIRKFIWADKTMSPVNEQTLYAPIEIGG
ncbi:hypothetical protein CPC08DRAFT_651953, partial [Agrocybe pediades]